MKRRHREERDEGSGRMKERKKRETNVEGEEEQKRRTEERVGEKR